MKKYILKYQIKFYSLILKIKTMINNINDTKNTGRSK